MEVRGAPPDYVLDQSTRRKIFFDEETDRPLLMTQDSRGKLRIPGSKSLVSVMHMHLSGQAPQQCSDTFIDFIERCLDWDPHTRINPYEALLHEWIIEGLPPKVLLHHKRMLGISQPDEITGTSMRTSPSLAVLPNSSQQVLLNPAPTHFKR